MEPPVLAPTGPLASISTVTETKLERCLRRTGTLKRKDRKVFREVDRLAPILARVMTLLDKSANDDQGETIDLIDDIRIVEGKRSHRFWQRLGLDDIRLDFTGERVRLRIAIDKLSSALISLIKTIDTSHSGSVLVMAAKLRALLAYHTFCRGIETRVAEDQDDGSSEEED
jgi:hypothetical protein